MNVNAWQVKMTTSSSGENVQIVGVGCHRKCCSRWKDILGSHGDHDRRKQKFASGIVQDDPVGTNRTMRELAQLMISISDIQLLLPIFSWSLWTVNVEQALVNCGHRCSCLNIPFLKTKELFSLRFLHLNCPPVLSNGTFNQHSCAAESKG